VPIVTVFVIVVFSPSQPIAPPASFAIVQWTFALQKVGN
jgi:hypothetical protein